MADLLQRRRFGWGSVFVGAGSVLIAASLIGSGPLGGIGAVVIAALRGVAMRDLVVPPKYRKLHRRARNGNSQKSPS